MKSWKTKSGYTVTRLLGGRSNVFLLGIGQANILIDTSPVRLWRTLDKRLRSSAVRKIDYLVLTHTHFDHAGNSGRIREVYGAKVIVHKDEAHCLAQGGNSMPAGTTCITRPLVKMFGNMLAYRFRYEPCQADITVDSALALKDLGFNAYILHTPGHSAGSMSVIIDDQIVLVGDAMFGIFPGSIFPPFADDVEQMVQSWGKLLATGCTLFMPSHGLPRKRALLEKEYESRKKHEFTDK